MVNYYYYTLKKDDEEYKHLKVNQVKHKTEMGLQSWIMKPIYGNDEQEMKKTINLNSFTNECIMCFDEKTDVMIYPCRHLSIGYNCAQKLRESTKCRECPVCRSKIERFIKINI